MAGYGRGYYGGAQLEVRASRRRRSWFTVVAVLGVGAAVVWLLWPRGEASGLVPAGTQTEPPSPPPPSPAPSPQVHATAAPHAIGAFLKQLEDDARERGFATVEQYEDSIVATAKQLQNAGAKVALAPQLQHLAPRLEAREAPR